FDDIELRARRIVEQIALVFMGGLLLRHAPSAVADAFCATRLGRDWGGALGTLPAGLDLAPILDRIPGA
ncbi:MAG TPA: DNA alkylation response protein, partial [Nocardioides sp.]|nr:DNA alkylation response protein [Nocardioides sp.]